MKIIDKIFSREDHTCPWWLCFTFDNPVRGLFQNPYKLLKDYIKADDIILDIGPGMGYFTFPLAELAGVNGRVTALDIQEAMLKRLEKRVVKKNIKNIQIKLYDGINFNLKEKFDFILLFWMYHEVKNKSVFIEELKSVLKPDGKILIAEPGIHVSGKHFSDSIKMLTDAGLRISGEPQIALSRAVLLENS